MRVAQTTMLDKGMQTSNIYACTFILTVCLCRSSVCFPSDRIRRGLCYTYSTKRVEKLCVFSAGEMLCVVCMASHTKNEFWKIHRHTAKHCARNREFVFVGNNLMRVCTNEKESRRLTACRFIAYEIPNATRSQRANLMGRRSHGYFWKRIFRLIRLAMEFGHHTQCEFENVCVRNWTKLWNTLFMQILNETETLLGNAPADDPFCEEETFVAQRSHTWKYFMR